MGLVSYVHVYGEDGLPVVFGPDDEVPEWAAAKMGAHCFEGGIHPSDVQPADKADESDESKESDDEKAEVPEPPHGGPGSGREAWEAFAAHHELEVDESMSRDQIIDALADAGIIEK